MLSWPGCTVSKGRRSFEKASFSVILLLPDLTENSSVSSLFSNHILPECLDFNIDSAKRHTKKEKYQLKQTTSLKSKRDWSITCLSTFFYEYLLRDQSLKFDSTLWCILVHKMISLRNKCFTASLFALLGSISLIPGGSEWACGTFMDRSNYIWSWFLNVPLGLCWQFPPWDWTLNNYLLLRAGGEGDWAVTQQTHLIN